MILIRVFIHRAALAICAVFAATALFAQTPPPAAKTPEPPKVAVDPPGNKLLDITVTTSKKRPVAGADLDILLHVKNVSQTTLFIDKKTSTLVYPSELTTGDGNGRNFIFFDGHSKGQFYPLQPNDETVLFASTDDSAKNGWWPTAFNSLRKFLSFSPSDFQLAAVVYYSTNPDEGDWHILTKDVTVPIGAPQWVVLFGAGLGGLCAYILFLRNRMVLEPEDGRRGESTKRILREMGNALSAVLFALVATILLSRISETQFFVRVTIEDLWGALAVGFVASYMGKGILDRLAGAPAPSQVAPRSSVTAVKREDHVQLELHASASDEPHVPLSWSASKGLETSRAPEPEKTGRLLDLR